MKKILYITNYKQGVGGISVQVDILQKHLKEEAWDVSLFNTSGGVFYRLPLIFRLYNQGKRFDIFHIHGCSYLGFFPIALGVTVGRLLNKKTIVTYHGGGAEGFFKKYPRFVRFFLLKSNVNIVLSGFLGNIFESYSIPFVVIPNVIEMTTQFFPERDKIRPNYISIRTLDTIYNVECIIRAFTLVQIIYPQASLTILGDGPCRAELEQLTDVLACKNVQFLGRVDNSTIYNYLTKCDIMVSAPLVDNQPVSILECFNAGLLVISSNVGGVPYMIENGVNGYLFESNNVNDLSEKMVLAVADHEKTMNMTKSAKRALEVYEWRNIRNIIVDIYLH